jgi:NADH:ubiquinone oxidoreductase subunit 6 (subunit J)
MGMILSSGRCGSRFFLLDAYFLGVLQVLVYAGAVMVLFLFIIMLLSDTEENPTVYPWRHAATGLAVFFLLAAGVLWLFIWSGAVPTNQVTFTPPELSSDPYGFHNRSQVIRATSLHKIFTTT